MYLAVNPATNRIYVCNSISNSVSVIDGSSNTVVATVPLSASPDGIDVNPTTNMIYVALFLTGEVVVIDGSSITIVTTIKGVDAFRVAVDAATNRIYGPQFLSTNVSVNDGASNTIIASIPVGKGSAGAATDSAANLIYVTNNTSGTISVIDGSTNTVTNTFTPAILDPGRDCARHDIQPPLCDGWPEPSGLCRERIDGENGVHQGWQGALL